MQEEIDNLVEMLKEELDFARQEQNPGTDVDPKEHKRARILLSLALAIQELQRNPLGK